MWKFISKLFLNYDSITIKLDREEMKNIFDVGPVVLSYEIENRIRFDFGITGKNEFIKKAVGESEKPITHTVKDVPVELILGKGDEILEIRFMGTVIVYDFGEGESDDFLIDLYSEGEVEMEHKKVEIVVKARDIWTIGKLMTKKE